MAVVLTLSIDPAKPFVYDKRKEGWKLKKDVKCQSGKVKLELAEILKSGEVWVKGTVMARRAKKMRANLGQRHLEAFLAKYERWTPPEGVSCITFPGTVWQDSRGGRYVPCLHWSGGQWYLCFNWLGSAWGSGGRLLRLRK